MGTIEVDMILANENPCAANELELHVDCAGFWHNGRPDPVKVTSHVSGTEFPHVCSSCNREHLGQGRVSGNSLLLGIRLLYEQVALVVQPPSRWRSPCVSNVAGIGHTIPL